jgi:NAD(P)-dependent dehydrogenase (short-subunit alcohol dehydrogenase family)
MGKLEGNTVIVTGSSYGIGRGIALRLGMDGARVVVNYTKSEEKAKKVVAEIEKSGSKAIALKADVSKSAEVRGLMEACVETFGGIDILVNNAGTNGRIAPIEEITEEDWDLIIDTNLKGHFLCIMHALPHMLKKKRGRIINMGSIDSFVGDPNFSTYVSSKHGIVGLTRSLALELGQKGITVNAICPGFVDTPSADIIEKLYPGVKEAVARKIPRGRLLRPEDVAAVASFLASDEAEMVNGSCIVVDGGMMLNVN